jgi:hypothetical protein
MARIDKWLIVSDTHGDLEELNAIIKYLSPLDGIIHLGDHAWDVDHLEFSGGILRVRGNTDRHDKSQWHQEMRIFNKTFYLTHGHREHVKFGLDKLYYTAMERQVDYVLFGHTHIPYDETVEGIRFFNPGSLTRPRKGNFGTFGVLEISEGNVDIKILKFEEKMLT